MCGYRELFAVHRAELLGARGPLLYRPVLSRFELCAPLWMLHCRRLHLAVLTVVVTIAGRPAVLCAQQEMYER